ncbi:MAG: XdhC family protein [Bacteroidia bacterium]|nr:XdhC family protein [Bacteroidia bacterium]NND51782.1 XdhC family protein [Flavobacteriaceae bacterium]
MTHEFKDIVEAYLKAKDQDIKAVLATVVDLNGSSYRKPGVRMLILENGQMIGAVSGGCVEKDIERKAQSVFKDKQPIMMTYDGRFRLGCEGVLYILLEEFSPTKECIQLFKTIISDRNDFKICSNYIKDEGYFPGLGSYLVLRNNRYWISGKTGSPLKSGDDLSLFEQKMPACFKLVIFGSEHDAVQLCQFAALNGWDVTIVAGPLESKTIANFPGARAFYTASLDALELKKIDDETAIMLMSHNFANDLKFLMELKDTSPAYIGLLGPSHRKEKLLSQLIEYCPEISENYVDQIHGPAGLNIGAETPQEIAISILSEILTVIRKKNPIRLKEKKGSIHA